MSMASDIVIGLGSLITFSLRFLSILFYSRLLNRLILQENPPPFRS